MNILTRYILKKFFTPFLASFSALCILVMVSQLFERLDRFLADEVSWKYVFGYLLSSTPYQSLQVLPVACLLGTLFVVGNIVRTREYIAGLAGGLAPERFLGGLFWAGFVISIFAFVANETFVPISTRYSRVVFREKIRHLGSWTQTVYADHLVAGAEGRIWNIKFFDQNASSTRRVVVDTFANGQLKNQVDAESAQWSTDKGWTFFHGVERTFDPVSLMARRNERFQSKSYSFIEKPEDLVTQEPSAEEMNFKTLKKHIKRLSSLGVPVRSLEVELMMKLAFPFSCFVVTLLGVPLSMRGKGNKAMGIAAGGVLTLFYMGFIQFGKALAQRHIPPWTGAWMGNIVFMTIGLLLWIKMRRTA